MNPTTTLRDFYEQWLVRLKAYEPHQELFPIKTGLADEYDRNYEQKFLELKFALRRSAEDFMTIDGNQNIQVSEIL